MLKTIRYRLEYLLFLLFGGVARTLPRPLALAGGRRLGDLMRLVQPRRRRMARKNLRYAYPEMGEAELEGLLKENFRQLGVSGVEMLRLDTYHDPQMLGRYFDFVGLDNLQQAAALDRGVFILTGHVGFWEAGAIFLPMLGYPSDLIYKKMKNRLVEQAIVRLRESSGSACVEKTGAVRRMLRSLTEKRAIALLVDQRINRREGVRIDFFGRPANATPVLAMLAIKQGVPIVPTFCRRLPDDRYETVFEPMILLPKESNPSAETVAQATQLLNDRIEAAIRRTPEQWFWLHDRWRL